MRLLSRFTNPTLPILIINSTLNQQRAVNLLAKLRQIDFSRSPALALLIEIENHMPVQVDKIVEFIKGIKREHGLPVYGFCHSHVSAEAYYLLSTADHLYTQPSTIFELKRGAKSYSSLGLLGKLGLNKFTIKSHEHLSGVSMDSFTSANTTKYINEKITEINERLFEEAMGNRNTPKTAVPALLVGNEAVQLGLAEGLGNYYDVLKSRYPHYELSHVKLKDKISTRSLQALVASPFIILLFLFKVLLKYTILMYLYMRHQSKTEYPHGYN